MRHEAIGAKKKKKSLGAISGYKTWGMELLKVFYVVLMCVFLWFFVVQILVTSCSGEVQNTCRIYTGRM